MPKVIQLLSSMYPDKKKLGEVWFNRLVGNLTVEMEKKYDELKKSLLERNVINTRNAKYRVIDADVERFSIYNHKYQRINFRIINSINEDEDKQVMVELNNGRLISIKELYNIITIILYLINDDNNNNYIQGFSVDLSFFFSYINDERKLYYFFNKYVKNKWTYYHHIKALGLPLFTTKTLTKFFTYYSYERIENEEQYSKKIELYILFENYILGLTNDDPIGLIFNNFGLILYNPIEDSIDLKDSVYDSIKDSVSVGDNKYNSLNIEYSEKDYITNIGSKYNMLEYLCNLLIYKCHFNYFILVYYKIYIIFNPTMLEYVKNITMSEMYDNKKQFYKLKDEIYNFISEFIKSGNFNLNFFKKYTEELIKKKYKYFQENYKEKKTILMRMRLKLLEKEPKEIVQIEEKKKHFEEAKNAIDNFKKLILGLNNAYNIIVRYCKSYEYNCTCRIVKNFKGGKKIIKYRLKNTKHNIINKQTSKRKQIKTSKRKQIKTSKRKQIKTSKRKQIKTSKRKFTRTFKQKNYKSSNKFDGGYNVKTK